MKLDRNTFPPGGWLFWQRETKWNAPNPAYDSFDETVNRIRNHRLANLKFKLSTDRRVIADELEARTLARLGMPAQASVAQPIPTPDAIPAPSTKGKPVRSKGCGTCGGRKR